MAEVAKLSIDILYAQVRKVIQHTENTLPINTLLTLTFKTHNSADVFS